ncbi:uncharacterized [Tachysurus ichikawai]
MVGGAINWGVAFSGTAARFGSLAAVAPLYLHQPDNGSLHPGAVCARHRDGLSPSLRGRSREIQRTLVR